MSLGENAIPAATATAVCETIEGTFIAPVLTSGAGTKMLKTVYLTISYLLRLINFPITFSTLPNAGNEAAGDCAGLKG